VVKIKISFLGGVQEVGRSAIKVESGGNVLMFDLGIAVSEPPLYPEMPDYADSLTLSHAHLDHSGMAPALYKRQSLPMYATPLTFQLSRILQEDNIKVTKERGYPLPYKNEDIENSLKGQIGVEYNSPRNVHSSLTMELFDAGHIPGSSSVLLSLEGKKLLYTGDINSKDTRLLNAAKIPEADILVIESTYGNRLHPDRRETEEALIASIEATVDSGGVALVPVFSVGRSQEILMVLKDVSAPIYLDGMAKLASKVILSNGQYVRDLRELQKATNHSLWVEHDSQRKDICENPCVVLTTAGMLNGGPVIQYLRLLAGGRRNSILLTGYQVEGTNGRTLVEKGYVLDPDTKKKLDVECEVKQFDFSAHADQSGLLDVVDKAKPQEIVLVHGSPESTGVMRQKLEEKGAYRVHAPSLGQSLEL